MSIRLGEVLPGRVGKQLAVPPLPVGGISEHPQVADLVHAAYLSLQERNHAPETGLDDGGAFLFVGRDKCRRLAGMQDISDLLDQHGQA